MSYILCVSAFYHDAPEDQPPLLRLLKAFEAKTGCGVLVNTSFNGGGSPLSAPPSLLQEAVLQYQAIHLRPDAYRCFMRTRRRWPETRTGGRNLSWIREGGNESPNQEGAVVVSRALYLFLDLLMLDGLMSDVWPQLIGFFIYLSCGS